MSVTKALMSEGRIGSLTLKNRIIMAPMGSNLAEADGHCGPRIQAHYEARAQGGAAMVIVGVGAIAWPVGACNPNQVAISDDSFLPGLRLLTERVQQHGCRAAIQLQHAGQVAICDISAGRAMLVPSIPPKKPEEMTAALTQDEMAVYVRAFVKEGAKIEYNVASKQDLEGLINDFADAAERAERAGFDGVELHAGHGYILSSFLSPFTNKRDDEYGGPIENRARLLVEVIQAVRARLGAEFPLWCRIDGTELSTAGGITLDDAKKTALMAQQAGADAIHVSAYANSAKGVDFTVAPLVHKPCGYVDFAVQIKRQLEIPVITVGRIDPQEADALIAKGQVDFVAMARKLLADPDLPKKLKEGRIQDIRPCIYCYVCVSQIFLNKPVKCAVNPATGRNAEFPIEQTQNAKRVLVVGGGPAGMECARVLALRGHRVTLCEKSNRLGGTVFFSSFVYAPNGGLIDYLEKQIRDLPVDIQLQQTVDVPFIDKQRPDVVVVAAGATRETPPISGAGHAHVFSGDELRKLMTGEDAQLAKEKLSLSQRALFGAGAMVGVTNDADRVRLMSKVWMPLGHNVVIIGGGLVGLELAEFFAERGRAVTVVEEGERFGVELSIVRRWRILHEIKAAGVQLLASTRVTQIDKDVVVCEEHEGGSINVRADSVVIAKGASANRSLSDALIDAGLEVHAIGDCSGVGYIEGAIYEAAKIARQI